MKEEHRFYINGEWVKSSSNELIEIENLSNICLLGHSMGGKTAMRFSQKYPSAISKLIIADIGRKKYPMHHDKIIQGLTSIDLNIVRSRNGAKEIFEADQPSPIISLPKKYPIL